jgi:methylglyoxal synthase
MKAMKTGLLDLATEVVEVPVAVAVDAAEVLVEQSPLGAARQVLVVLIKGA